jgi:hypothetical protein
MRASLHSVEITPYTWFESRGGAKKFVVDF